MIVIDGTEYDFYELREDQLEAPTKNICLYCDLFKDQGYKLDAEGYHNHCGDYPPCNDTEDWTSMKVLRRVI